MSNIVGFNDSKKDNKRTGNFALADASKRSFFSAQLVEPINPKDETFVQMLLINVCPHTTKTSFSIIFSLILIVVFIAQVCIDGLNPTLLYEIFLPININGPFTSKLSNDYDQIKYQYEYWRIITSIFIHQNAPQLLGSMISLLIWTSFFEVLITAKRLPQYFFMAGIIGNLMAITLGGKGVIYMGALIGVFGIYGAVLGYLAYNWTNMKDELGTRILWLCQLGIILLFSFSMGGFGENAIMNASGFICGFPIGLCYCVRFEKSDGQLIGRTKRENVLFWTGICLVVAIITACLLSINLS